MRRFSIPDLSGGAHRFAAFMFASVLVVLNVLRIFNVPITHDETGYSVHHSYTDLIVNRYASANNHVLHSLIRKFLVEHFTDSLFFLRADSLVAQVIFLLSTYGICSLLTHRRWLGLAGFVLLNVVSPLLFQFWGLSRGYGLALALLSVSVLYLLRYITAGRSVALIACLAAAVLSVYANFSFVNYYIALCGTVIVHRLLFRRSLSCTNTLATEWFIVLASAGVLAGLITTPLVSALSHGELQFLGTTGFWADTVASLVKDAILISNSTKDTREILTFVLVLCTILPAVYWSVAVIRSFRQQVTPSTQIRTGVVLFLLFVIPAFSIVAQHVCFGINYLLDRAALFFVPLYFIHLIFWLGYMGGYLKVVGRVFLLLFLVAGTYNFVANTNLSGTHLWWYSAADRMVMQRINRQAGPHEKVTVCVGWMHEPTFNYNFAHQYKGGYTIVGNGAANKDTAINYYYVSVSEADQLPAGFFRDTVYVGGAFALYRRTVADEN